MSLHAHHNREKTSRMAFWMQQAYLPATFQNLLQTQFLSSLYSSFFTVVEKGKKQCSNKIYNIIFITNNVKYYFPSQEYHVISVPVSKLNQFSH